MLVVLESREPMFELQLQRLCLCTFPIDEGFELLPHAIEIVVILLSSQFMNNIVLRGLFKGPSA